MYNEKINAPADPYPIIAHLNWKMNQIIKSRDEIQKANNLIKKFIFFPTYLLYGMKHISNPARQRIMTRAQSIPPQFVKSIFVWNKLNC